MKSTLRLCELSCMLEMVKSENNAGVSCLRGQLLTPGSGDQGSSYLRSLNYSTSVDIDDTAPCVKCHPTVRLGVRLDPGASVQAQSAVSS